MDNVFALIDCDNFFVACEQLFRPDLVDRPVVVLSNNDGCVVSRSNEAKALGIPMGAPAFKYRPVFDRHGVKSFSANFELYGDISHRLISLLTAVTPRTEVYSVDESFLELSNLSIPDLSVWAVDLRRRLKQEIGIPVSIGLASSKTLAKLAVTRAKKNPASAGTLDLTALNPAERQAHLRLTPIGDVWGVGRRLTPRLQVEGLYTALDLSQVTVKRASSLLGVHGRRLVMELNGTSCLALEPFGRLRQSLMHGRVFGRDSGQFEVIEAAIATLVAKAAATLRSEGLLAGSACLQLSTNRHKPNFLSLSRFLNFSTPSSDGGQLASQLASSIKADFRPGAPYHRVNVSFYNLLRPPELQADLFGFNDLKSVDKAKNVGSAIDRLNNRYGQKTLYYAAEDLSHDWQSLKEHRSPHYVTDWQELPTLH